MKFEIESECEVCLDEHGVPILSRFFIREPMTDKVVAVVEAYTLTHARKRFLKLRPYLRDSLKSVIDEFFTVERPTDEIDPNAFPLFLNTFFDVVDASERLKH